LTLYTFDICKLIRQVAASVVAVTLKLSVF